MVSPDPGVADIVTVPGPHLEFGPAVGAEGRGLTITSKADEVAVQLLLFVTLTV